MTYDNEKIDEVVLALLYLTSFSEDHNVHRSWKGHDWEALNRLHDKGFISDPKRKSKSIIFSDEGFQKSRKLFEKHFKGAPILE